MSDSTMEIDPDEIDGAATDWEAIYWDIGGVILDVATVKRGHRRFLERLVGEYDLECTVEEARETWGETIGGHFRDREGSEFRSAQVAYSKAVTEIVGRELPREEWQELFRDSTDGTIVTNPGARAAISTLAETDLHVGVISDADREEALHILEHFGVKHHFDSFTISEDVGRTKPDPAMFETALEAAAVEPERALMIGDRYEHDMEGAKRLGMGTIAHGAAAGDAVDYRIDVGTEDLTAVLEIVAGRRE